MGSKNEKGIVQMPLLGYNLNVGEVTERLMVLLSKSVSADATQFFEIRR